MSTSEEDDPDIMSDAKLLAVPLFNVAPGNLSRLWARHSAILHQRDVDELALERSGDSGRPFMIFRDQDPKEKRRREEEQRRQAWLAYEQAMLEIHERSDRLLARIEEQERIIEKRRKEIDENAIRLHDGRRVYVDGDQFRDEEGRVLNGADADEAHERHRGKPDASTWADKKRIEDQLDEAQRFRQKILKEREEAMRDGRNLGPDELERKRKEADQRMSNYDKEYHDKFETTLADLAAKSQAELTAAYNADYNNLDGGNSDTGRTTSYAKTQDGAGRPLSANFTLAAEGQGAPEKEKAPQPSSGAPKVQT
jgi:hypothetical protein